MKKYVAFSLLIHLIIALLCACQSSKSLSNSSDIYSEENLLYTTSDHKEIEYSFSAQEGCVFYWADDNPAKAWNEHSLKEGSVFVPNEDTALKIAIAVFEAQYPHLKHYEPSCVVYHKIHDAYTICFQESIHSDIFDDSSIAIVLDRQTGQILNVYVEY